jgi:[protein-PII] uridylyltransferase
LLSRRPIVDIAYSDAAPDAEGRPSIAALEAGEGIDAFRRLIKVETERLRIRHRFGRGGREVAAGRSDLVDLIVARACRLAAAECAPSLGSEQDEIAVVALGGYGRREMAPFSDVDLLFLRGDRADEDVRALVERALALLWDSGLTIGHSFRTAGECVTMARDDLHSRTAMAEARLVAGSPRLFSRLIERLEALVFASARTTAGFLESLRHDLHERYARYGGAVGLLEPQVKESAGGLRDLHVVLWAGHAIFGARGLAALHARGVLSDGERKALLRSHDHLARVRNEAHFATGRKTDLLDLELQPVIAHSLGYRARPGFLASELFMRDYYERASELHRISRAFVLRHAPAPARRLFSLSLLRRRPRGTFEIREGKLYPRGEAAALGSARRLLEAFAIAQREGPELSEELKLDIRGSLRHVDRRFRESREAGRAFTRLLEHKGRVGPVLRGMHETGLLGRLLPEFARVTFLVQHDFYHRYTVDEHTLTAVDALDAVAAPAPDSAPGRLAQVLEQVAHPGTLYLGLLLHDIGKGRGGGHCTKGARIAQRVCARLGLEEGAAADVVFLVEAHLEMSQISQRRDFSEPGLVEGFARRVGTLDRLNMLFLLTYADHCGVGPGVWTEWKGALLWDLYDRTRAFLTPSSGRAEETETARERAARHLEAEFPPSEVERHFALLPERYLRVTEASHMIRHFRLTRRLGDEPLVAEWHSSAHATEVVIVARDHPGLFAELAGTLTAQRLDILSVDLYTREDGIALDVFKVREVGDHGPLGAGRRGTVESALLAAVSGAVDVAAAVEKRRQGYRRRSRRPVMAPRVAFDWTASAERTVVEVRAEDEAGLAFRIASVLSANGLDIAFAKVATEKSHALDVFYVTGAEGGPLTADESARVEAALLAALDPRQGNGVVKEKG